MNLTDSIEIKKIKEWAQKDNKYGFSMASDRQMTYYEEFVNKRNIEEYDFEGIPGFIDEMKKFWEDKDNSIHCVCAVAAFKMKADMEEEEFTESNDETNPLIPDFVYVF